MRNMMVWTFQLRISNVKKLHIGLVVIGALIPTLFAILPAFGAGAVSFIDPDAFEESDQYALKDPVGAPDEQKWARQGGFIGLMYEDESLDRPVRRVLIPHLDTTFAGSADIEAHSATIKIKTGALAANDYVMIGTMGESSVHKALKVTPATDTVDGITMDDVTLDRPFYESRSDQEVHKIKPEVIDTASVVVDWQNDYGLYASAIELSYVELLIARDVALLGDLTIYRGTNIVANSDIANTDGTAVLDNEDDKRLGRRLTGRDSSSTNRTNSDDALIVRVTLTGTGGMITDADYYTGSITDTVDSVRNERVEFRVSGATDQNPLNIGNPRQIGPQIFANEKVYLAAWFEERNDTGAAVSVRSQAYQADITLVLRETLPDSGKFALKIGAVRHGADNADQTQLSMTVTNADDGVPRLPVNPSDVVTMSTTDSIGTISVESSGPTFTGFSPSSQLLRQRRPPKSLGASRRHRVRPDLEEHTRSLPHRRRGPG